MCIVRVVALFTYLNVLLFSCQICMIICMYVGIKSFLKNTIHFLCVCAHLANKAHSDSIIRLLEDSSEFLIKLKVINKLDKDSQHDCNQFNML